MELYRHKAYPAPAREALLRQGPLAVEVANRWMLGWPGRVCTLLEAGTYLPALIAQVERERDAPSQPGNGHLARHEIAELYGLDAAPPAP